MVQFESCTNLAPLAPMAGVVQILVQIFDCGKPSKTAIQIRVVAFFGASCTFLHLFALVQVWGWGYIYIYTHPCTLALAL